MSRAERKALFLAQALLIYVEPFVRGRRAIVVGDGSLGLGERLIELGARSVHVFDADPSRIPPPPTSDGSGSPTLPVVSRALPEGELEFRDGAFDCGIVVDPAGLSDPALLLARVRRVLSRDGCLFLSAPNIEITGARGLSYAQLFDLVALQFERVAVLGRVPWSGVAFARLGADADAVAVTVDTQLVAEQPPVEAYVLVGSQEDHELDPYLIVQLPPGAEERPGADIAAFAEVKLQAEMLSAQLEESRTLSTRLGAAAAASAVAAVAPANQEALEAAATRADAALTRAEQAEARVQQEFSRAERLVQATRELDETVESARREADRFQKEADLERKARKKLEIEVALLQERLEKEVPVGPTIRVATPKRGFDVESTVALRDDQLENLKDELAGSFPSAPALAEGSDVAPKAAHLPQLLARANAAKARADRAEDQAEEAETRAEEAEKALGSEKARADEAAQAAAAANARAGEAERTLSELRRSLEGAEARVSAAEAKAAASEARAVRYEREQPALTQTISHEVQALEEQLRERGRRVAELDAELQRRERMIHDLIDGLSQGALLGAAVTEALPRAGASGSEAPERTARAPVVAGAERLARANEGPPRAPQSPPMPVIPRPSPSGVTLSASGPPPAGRPAIDPAAYHALEASFLRAQSIVELQAQEIDLLTQERIEAKEKLRQLGIELARYQGEVFARDWRVTELEQNLAMVTATQVRGG